jgi:hypothetical protein
MFLRGACALGALSALAGQASAVVPGGTNILHVPMAWCVVNGSPAAAAPNVLSEGTTLADTNTDAVIWRRHERPTDNVFIPGASISLRSSVNDAWGTFTFPMIADPNTAVGLQGDVNSTDNTEIMALQNNCDARYASQGRAGIGITAVNVNLWTDASGNHATNNSFQVGLGGCSFVGPAGSPCSSDFFIIVADNHYFYPTVPNRTIPGLAGTPFADPLDLAVAHETGHALSLPHRTLATAVMNPSLVDNNGDQRVDNTGLNASEVSKLRATAANVPGLETDPPGTFVPGSVTSMRVVDGGRERRTAKHLDLAALTLSRDRGTDTVRIAQRLWGLLPCTSRTPNDYGYLADLDNDARTGAPLTTLASLGLPTKFHGADLIARASVVGGARKGRDYSTCQSTITAWVVNDGKLVELNPDAISFRIKTMRTFRVFSPDAKPTLPLSYNLLNTLEFGVRNRVLPAKVREKAPLRLVGLTVSGRKPIDVLGKGTGTRFILEQPRFPHCFPAAPGTPGGTISVTFDGLRPNREVHALLGPIEVLRGVVTDAAGSGSLELPIPRNATVGNHLITIGHDGLALTADCTATVR